MDHAVGVGADDALGALAHVQIREDLVEAGAGPAGGEMGDVGDGPEAVGPGHEGADAGFGAGRVVVRGEGEGGDDAADGEGC